MMLVACQSTPLESSTGHHATVHWDPAERRLCGGTLAYIDSSLEVVAAHYGVDLPAEPALEIFWIADEKLDSAVCGGHAGGCAVPWPNGTSLMFSDNVIDPHELTHTIRLTGTNLALPTFFNEGVASRWENGWSDSWTGKDNYVGDLDYPWLLEKLRGGRLDSDAYFIANFFWSWLEAEHGADRMADFAAQLGPLSSIGTIERAFEQTFGLSLEQAVEASRGQPMYMFDIHACAMHDLPTLTWSGETLTLSNGPGDCSDSDVVNFLAGGATRSVRVELAPGNYEFVVEGGPGNLRIDNCYGVARPHELARIFSEPQSAQAFLGGEYIVTAIASIEPDGSVNFPVARLEQP
ncbi:MAG: hypothetical protein R6X02_32400 [Enhygromyxa sp.]